MLREAGFSVGLYTSPHLVSFRERIRVLKPGTKSRDDFEGMISRSRLADVMSFLAPAMRAFSRRSPYGALTFFEAYTALAFEYFRRLRLDVVVLETGMGGRLDATNAVTSLVQVITPISYEHTDYLGTSLQAIARQKAGIIKPGSIVVSVPQKPEVLRVIERTCRTMRSNVWRMGKEFAAIQGAREHFSVVIGARTYPCLRLRLKGEHQVENAAVAVAAVEALRRWIGPFSRSSVARGLAAAVWPGRCEFVAHRPRIVLDGAHNNASAHCLRKTIEKDASNRRAILIIGTSDDKDIAGICAPLVPLMQTVLITKSRNPRAASPSLIERAVKRMNVPGQVIMMTDSVLQARKEALRLARPQDMIVVTGSLFVVGEFRRAHIQ